MKDVNGDKYITKRKDINRNRKMKRKKIKLG